MSWLPASHGERRQEHEPRQLQLGKSEAAAAAVSTTDEITTKGRAKRSVNAEKKNLRTPRTRFYDRATAVPFFGQPFSDRSGCSTEVTTPTNILLFSILLVFFL